jgi:GNAT superfamily N-acetyltransferase
VRVVEYDPSRRGDVAALMGRVWGESPAEGELAWFFEGNPVRPASVLLAEEDGKTVASVAMSFVRMSLGGEAVEVGMPVRLATDPGYRGRGIFADLESQNEGRARELGIPLLLIVANAASTPILVGRLGWKTLPSIRVWARPRLGRGAPSAPKVARLDAADGPGGGDRVLRDSAWLGWRFTDSPWGYTLLARAGYGVARHRGRVGVLAAVRGDLVSDTAAAAGGPVVIAAPPPWLQRHYLRAGFLPTHRTFTVLGKSLDPARPVPARPHFELGDLDFV